MAAELLLMIPPGFALGAPRLGNLVLDEIRVAISGGGRVPTKKLNFGREFFAWTNLGNCGVVVGCVVGFTLGWVWFVAVPQGCDRG
eukprot:12172966-Ditylum_brightwellii.AAC.1